MAGYSGTPLAKKLGLRDGTRLNVIAAPRAYASIVRPLPAVIAVGPRARADVIHVFVTRRSDLVRRLPGLRRRIAPDGMVWVSWPKRTSGVATDVTEDVVRRAALDHRLVDVKVCAVDATWSALKLVIRKADR